MCRIQAFVPIEVSVTMLGRDVPLMCFFFFSSSFLFFQLVRTCARYHVEVRKAEERKKMEEELRLRNIASVIAREVDYFWSNIEQVKKKKIIRYTFIYNLYSCVNFPASTAPP